MIILQPDDSIKDKAVSITRFIVALPSSKRTVAYLLSISFIAGFLLKFGFGGAHIDIPSLGSSFVFGGAEGVILFAIPALIASVLSASFARKEDFSHRLKHFSFISFLSTAVLIILYIAGVFLYKKAFMTNIEALVLIANSLVFIIWFFALFITLNYSWKTAIISLLHPLLNISFLVIWDSFLLADVQDSSIILLKFLVSSLVLLVAAESLFYIINAPAKRNFGVSTMQAATLLFSQWVYGTKGIENILAEMGEKAETSLGFAVFRNRKDKKLKATFLVPGVHFGPFGNVGGSEFPFLISEHLGKNLNCGNFVFHSTTTHDFNPVYSASSEKMAKAFETGIRNLHSSDFSSEASALSASGEGNARIFGLSFGKKNAGFFALTRAPESTEDIDLAIGALYSEELKSKGFSEAIIADMHNSKFDGSMISMGEKSFYDFYDLIARVSPPSKKSGFSLGVAQDALSDFSAADGIGKGGLKVAVFGIGGKKSCLILFDANNVLPEFRRELLLSMKLKHSFSFCDVMTTDTHYVNSIGAVHNPLGAGSSDLLLKKAESLVEEALNDMEPCEAALSSRRIEVEVLGSKRSLEVLSTVNSVIAIAKIFAPLILVASVAVAFYLLVFFR